MTQNIWELNLTSLTRTITANCGTHGIYLARCKMRSWIRSTSLAKVLHNHWPVISAPGHSAHTSSSSSSISLHLGPDPRCLCAEPSSRQFNDRRRGKYLNVCTTIFLQFRGKNCSENTQGCNVSWASQLRGPHYRHYSLCLHCLHCVLHRASEFL